MTIRTHIAALGLVPGPHLTEGRLTKLKDQTVLKYFQSEVGVSARKRGTLKILRGKIKRDLFSPPSREKHSALFVVRLIKDVSRAPPRASTALRLSAKSWRECDVSCAPYSTSQLPS